jgi:hypothetical protein
MTDRAPPRGVLAMSDAELSAFIRDIGITFPVLTPEAKAEAQRENEYLEAHESGAVREAFESGAIWRKKPGRTPGESKERAAARAIAQACLDKAAGRSRFAKQTFINRAPDELHIGPDSAKNLWYEVTEADSRTTRRVR